MQDLKTSKQLRDTYYQLSSSYQSSSHKHYLTPYNVETLVSCLHQIRDQQTTYNSRQQKNCSFVDSYINTTLPTVASMTDHRPIISYHHKRDPPIVHHQYWSKLEPLNKTQVQSTPTIVNKEIPSAISNSAVIIQPIRTHLVPAAVVGTVSSNSSSRLPTHQCSRL